MGRAGGRCALARPPPCPERPRPDRPGDPGSPGALSAGAQRYSFAGAGSHPARVRAVFPKAGSQKVVIYLLVIDISGFKITRLQRCLVLVLFF